MLKCTRCICLCYEMIMNFKLHREECVALAGARFNDHNAILCCLYKTMIFYRYFFTVPLS